MAAGGGCPTATCGVWVQDRSRCESLCPFLEGLGLPKSLLWAACPVVDGMKTTLRISCPAPGELEIVDKTPLGRNATRVATDGTEDEHFTRGRKKPFMLSASVKEDSSTLTCRLISRGSGWFTHQERFLDATGDRLIERHVLQRPGHPDVEVKREFVRGSDEDLRPSGAVMGQ